MNAGAIKKIPVGEVLSHAKTLEYELKLFAADAVHLAAALYSASGAFITEDIVNSATSERYVEFFHPRS